MKGQAALIIIFLIIIGIAMYFFWPHISKITHQEPVKQYKNDIITVERFDISDLNPYAGSPVVFKIYIKNNGDKEINDVKVIFSDTPGLENKSITCEQPSEVFRNTGCIFKNVGSLDMREATLTANASSEIIIAPQSFPISYRIEYNYFGYRIVSIPIIDGITRTSPLSQFSASETDYGPIVLEIQPSIEKKVDGVVKRNWAVNNTPFKVEFKFSDIVKKARYTTILAGDLKINLTDLDLYNPSLCDFVRQDNLLISKKDVFVSGKESAREETLMCYFISKNMTEPEISSSISAKFNYTYIVEGSEKITIQPIPK